MDKNDIFKDLFEIYRDAVLENKQLDLQYESDKSKEEFGECIEIRAIIGNNKMYIDDIRKILKKYFEDSIAHLTIELVNKLKHLQEYNLSIAKEYGSEVAGDSGTKERLIIADINVLNTLID